MTPYQKGVEAFRAGRFDEAERRFRIAAREIPGKGAAAAWCYLGIVLTRQQRGEAAADAFTAAIAADPAHAESHFNLGLVCHLRGEIPAAIRSYELALAHRGDYPDAIRNLAVALETAGDAARAVQLYRQLLQRNSRDAWTCNNLATLLKAQGSLEEALGLFQRALEIDSEYPAAFYNLGNVLKELGRPDEALQPYGRAAALEPGNPTYGVDFGFALLASGQWLEGWPWYEYRDGRHFNRPPLHGPEWRGEPVDGKSLLLYSEQGFGDVFMMFRYADVLVDAGAEVTVMVPRALQPLLRRGHGRFRVLSSADELAATDFDCPIMSLPLHLHLTLDSIRPVAPYVFARATERPAALQSDGLHVGLVWGGNPRFPDDRNRSLPHFRELAPLLDVEGVCFHSLQKEPRAGECLGFPVSQPLPDSGEWDDTAAFANHLDLIITTDTAMAHLAGAMGLPVWLLLHKLPDWRWYPYGEATPWYPSMRLFMQPNRGDWAGVVQPLRERLTALVSERPRRRG